MGKTLVIVESPTKAKTISKFLGSSYFVESSFGHIRDLPKSKMGIDIEGGTFEPTYTIPRDKSKQVKKLKDLAAKCDDIIFATDEDREGEAISWHLAHVLDVKPENSKRIVFHEITKSAIEEALKHPRNIDKKLVDAQQARRVLDRLVGYELSPFLWKKVARGLSAGRVQSVAVALIVEREKEIRAFNPEEYWSLGAKFQKQQSEHIIESKLYSIDGKKVAKLDLKNKEQVDSILADLNGVSYSIEKIEKKQTKRNPPPPFQTSTLQQTANNKFGYSSKQTMRIAQQLYEGISIGAEGSVGLITYMRTDSLNLSEKFLQEAKTFVGSKYGEKYSLEKPRFYKTKSKSAQEAHEAIRPTDPAKTPESLKDYLDPSQLKVYSLIWKRALATQMAQAVLDKTNVDIKENKEKYLFRANGQTIQFDGWLKLYPEATKQEMLPELSEKEALNLIDLQSEQHFTQPPARYSDATLVKALEEHGIGRPSTYAPTIGTIEARSYVERDENKRLKPLDVAFIVTELLQTHFKLIVDLGFTAQMEENLDEIAEGKKDWQPIISTFYHPFHENLEEKLENISRDDISKTRELGIDPKTQKPVSARIGRFGPYVQLGAKEDEEKPRFASIPKGKELSTITLEEALHLLSLPRTLGQTNEGKDIIANVGRFGPYIQVEKNYYSLKKYEKDPFTITFEEAEEIIKLSEEEQKNKIIKTFDGTDIQILRGPYGPYITNGEKNARIPKDQKENPEKITQAECEALLEKAKPKRKRKAPAKKKKNSG
ncbi:MAG: DNA topoisomerase I [Candidatus Magasanikbacteria bacterium CG11_big_fil_rev_8_21_14_0_20_39_34]|uniref:DNA topoisomerase 1 n=1 Tax=Candidatus Magasanikbacteria bacterium CG11_big_fil_rev_8_21_14_0_20_39_34 TaxID=1974653 RepID=A0A2H0N6Y7_9BACT|nr:MAG: DNA topoisomerase I [Candidatus Magasanikbacteria bacterium CG11_big_fil_rev_8_21_14_0_20_39_34]